MLECQGCGMPVTEELAQQHGATLCRKCAARGRQGVGVAITPAAPVAPARPAQYYIPPSSRTALPASTSLLGPIIGGLIGGLLGGLVWFGFVVLTKLMLGYLAIGIGWVVGFGTLMGAKNEKGGSTLMLVSGSIAFLTMFVSEYCIFRHIALAFIANKFGPDALARLDPDLLSHLIFRIIGHEWWTIFFWVIAVYFAVKTVREDS